MVDLPPAYPCAKLKLDQFFLQWVVEHPDLITSLLDDAVAGRPLRGPNPVATAGTMPLSPSTVHAIFSAATPPLSPSKPRSPRSPLSPQRKTSLNSALKRPPHGQLPQFYFPSVLSVSHSTRDKFQELAVQHFREHPEGLDMDAFCSMTHVVGELPRMIGRTLFRQLAGVGEGVRVTLPVFTAWWTAHGMLAAPAIKRVYEVLRKHGQEYLTAEDFQPFMDIVLRHHMGLEFLVDTTEFQAKYAMTVIYRIFYNINSSCDGRITLRELRRSDLLEALDVLDQEEDINKVLKYFSYEHFYVIYCKFWELDKDHDFFISKDELAGYSGYALSEPILARVFEQAPRKFSSGQADRMGYEDFVWFILCEEDKTSEPALEYWFKCVDLDGDGVITPREMWFFYEEQLKRLESLSQEAVHFPDLLCQLHDMLLPAVEGSYTLRDLKRTRLQSGLLFNALFNLHKFLAFENRDPFASRAEANDSAGLSDWDKFARQEYFRLASEDEGEPGEVQMEADEQGPWHDDAPMLDMRVGVQ